VREAFAIPQTFDPIGAITIGHRTASDGAPGSPRTRPRKAQADVVHHARWTS
jgi:nitroreductase